MSRTFEARKAVRERTPLIISLVGPSGTGKTKSALRLADGINRVDKGKVFLIDTEARRALHYAGEHDFQHVPFGAPFSPLDYLDAFLFCVERGATVIIVDSMSHEWEGPGGVLEWHDNEKKRLGDPSAWGKPKGAHRRMINTMLQIPVSFVLCFRSKEKMLWKKGEEPKPLGWMPIGAEELIYEATLACLLTPGANGFPHWKSDMAGELASMKLPGQFREMFANDPQLSEDLGEKMARWAAGVIDAPVESADAIVARLGSCSDAATMRAIEDTIRASWKGIAKPARERISAAITIAKERMERADRFEEDEGGAPSPDEQREIAASEKAGAQ